MVSKEELKEALSIKGDIEKTTTISSDSRTLSTRIPKDIIDELEIKKGDKIRWIVKKSKLTLEIEKCQ